MYQKFSILSTLVLIKSSFTVYSSMPTIILLSVDTTVFMQSIYSSLLTHMDTISHLIDTQYVHSMKLLLSKNYLFSQDSQHSNCDTLVWRVVMTSFIIMMYSYHVDIVLRVSHWLCVFCILLYLYHLRPNCRSLLFS